MSKSVFVIGLNTALSPPPVFDMNKYLYRFQQDITSDLFVTSSEETNRQTFKNIWTLLLKVANNPSSTTRLAAYRATGAFLIRITPYYPELILQTFSEISTQTTIDVKSSAVVASAFAYLSTYVAKPKLAKFVASTPVFHHFSTSDAAFSEHLAAIVSNLGHLGIDWLKNLLRYFLERFEESNSRHVIKAINAIINHQPELFLREMIDSIDVKERVFLNLLAFLVCGNRDRLGDVDLMPIAKVAIATLDDAKSTAADLDCALQLLSVKSDSFSVIVEDGGDGTLHFKAWNSQEKAEANLQFSKVSGRPSVYMVNLPFRMLVPKQEESVLVLSEKFKTLAMYDGASVLDVYAVYEPYLLGEYNERSSGAIQGLAFCVNKFLKGVTSQKLNVSLRKVLFSKPVSWFHSFDILRVMKKIDAKLFNEVMGEECFLELLKTLVGFCFSENDSMSAESITALRNLTTNHNYEKVMRTIVESSEYFDPLLLRRSIATITGILLKMNKNTQILDIFSERLVECISYFDDNMLVFMEILKFFALYQWPIDKLKDLTNIALCLIQCSIEFVSGKSVIGFPELSQKDIKYYREVIENDVATRNVDIITEPSTDYHAFIMPMRESLRYLFARKPFDCFVIATDAFQLFPLECSKYFYDVWSTLDNEMQNSVIAIGSTNLQFVGDDSVHAIWCQLCIDHPELTEMPEISNLLEFLNQTATQCLALSMHQNDTADGVYSSFLLKFVGSDHPAAFMKQMAQKSLSAFLTCNPSLIPFAEENIPEKMSSFTQLTVDSSDMEFEGMMDEALPTKIEDNQIPLLFEQYVRHANVVLVSQILEIARERKIEISIKDVAFPPVVIPTVATYLAENQPNIITLSEAIAKVRTSWRPLAIARIKASSTELLETLLLDQKPKRRIVINLNSIVDEVDFDCTLLFKLASKLVFEAETPHRFQATLHLLATIIAKQEKLQPSFIKEFVSNTESKLANMDGNALSLICLIFAQKVAAEKDFIQFVRKTMVLCGNKTPANARLNQILVGVSSVTTLVGRSFIPSLPDLLQGYMTSVLPSRYMAGLRLLEQTDLSIPVDRLLPLVRTSFDIIADRFIYMSGFPVIIDLHFRAIMSLLIKQGAQLLHTAMFKQMPHKFILPDSHPAYTTAIRIWMQVMRLLSPTAEYFRKVASVVDILLASRFSDSVGIRCLKEKIGKLSDNEHQGTFIEALLSWIDSVNQRGTVQLVQRVGEWYQIARDIDLSLVGDLTSMLFAKLNTFWPVYVNIVKIYRLHSNDADFVEIVRSTSEGLSCNCHKNALLLLLENHSIEKLLKLAEFAADCAESEKLLAEIIG